MLYRKMVTAMVRKNVTCIEVVEQEEERLCAWLADWLSDNELLLLRGIRAKAARFSWAPNQHRRVLEDLDYC